MGVVGVAAGHFIATPAQSQKEVASFKAVDFSFRRELSSRRTCATLTAVGSLSASPIETI
jgi:hypothetical protein